MLAALHRYSDLVQQELEWSRTQDRLLGDAGRRLVRNDQLLLQAVDRAEKSPEFGELVRQAASGNGRSDADTINAIDRLMASERLRTFFRNSGFYLDLFDDKRWNPEELERAYVEAFKLRRADVDYLVPIEGVEFAQEILEFDGFEIRRFQCSELDEILRNRVRKVFSPEAEVDTHLLSHYWMLHVTEVDEQTALDHWDRPFADRTPQPYSWMPKAVEKAATMIALWDWHSPADWPGWVAPQRPFDQEHQIGEDAVLPGLPLVITASKRLLDAEESAPNLGVFRLEPYCHPETGDVLDFVPARPWWEFDEEQTRMFEDHIRRTQERISDLGDLSELLHPGLDLLLKGFLSRGVGQFLWHVMAIDALVGENGKKRIIAKRTSALLASEGDAQEVRCLVEGLYELRSKYVHGAEGLVSGGIGQRDLSKARDLARAAAVRMIDHLCSNRNSLPGTERSERRRRALDILDKRWLTLTTKSS